MSRHFSYNLLNIGSRLLNFILFWIIVNKFGASTSTDWFYLVYGFVYFLIAITFYSLECALVPIWPKLPPEKQQEFFLACMFLGGISAIALQIFGLCFSLYVPHLFGFSNPFNRNDTLSLSFLLFLQPALAYFAALHASLLQAKGHYFWPLTHLTLRTLGVLVIVLFRECAGVFCLGVSYTIGELLRMLVLSVISLKLVGPLKLTGGFNIGAFRQYFAAIGWLALMVCASASNAYIDLIMVGHFGGGMATLVEYGGRLRGLPLLALSGIMVVFLGDWSRNQAENLTWREVKDGSFKTTWVAVVFTIALILTRKLWLPVIFRGYQFSADQVTILNELILWFLIGAPFMVATNLVSRGFLVWQRYKLLAFMSLVSIGINVALNLLFIKLVGVSGVAMSTAGVDILLFAFSIYYGTLFEKRRIAGWQ